MKSRNYLGLNEVQKGLDRLSNNSIQQKFVMNGILQKTTVNRGDFGHPKKEAYFIL